MQTSRPPEDSFLHKTMSYDIEIVKIGPPVFCTARPFTQPQGEWLDILWCSVCLCLTFVTFFVKKYFF